MKRVFGICSLALVGACMSQPTAIPLPSFSDFEAERRAQMIEHVTTIVDMAAGDDAWDLSIRSQDVASAGREDLHEKFKRPHFQPDRLECKPDAAQPPLDEITRLAESHSIVIINEHHAEPRHRVFIGDLAARLREQGFTHFAAEAFAPSGIDGEGYPRSGDGYYTSEPMMARTIYRLRALGYELVAYEARQDQVDFFDDDVQKQINDREEAQAVNLMEAVLSERPDTKILIHVGHGHVAEFPPPIPDAIPWMAARLKAKSGIDPLTISLTQCRSMTGQPVLSTQAVNADGKDVGKVTDYLVGLPPKTMVRERPAYRLALGDQFVELPEALRSKSGPIMIEARPRGADLAQSPIERVVLGAGEDLPLLLPPGAWSLVSIDDQGAVIGMIDVDVAAEQP